jgi:intracellular septation protein A
MLGRGAHPLITGVNVDTSSDAPETVTPTEPAAANRGGWIRSLATIVIVDVAAPLAGYSVFRSAGLSAVTALALSGVFPAMAVIYGAIRHRRFDVVGALVLAGIVLGVVLGLTFHSARLVLVEGSVPTAVFGIACLGSLRTRPLMYRICLEFLGPDSPRSREMAGLWQYDGFRQVWRVINAAWGAAFLLEAALRVVIVYNTSPGTALAISKVTPYLFIGVMIAWTVAYGTYRKKKGERDLSPER